MERMRFDIQNLKIDLSVDSGSFLKDHLRTNEEQSSGFRDLKNWRIELTGDESSNTLAPTFSPTAFNPYKQLQTGGGGGSWSTTNSIILVACLTFGVGAILYVIYRRCKMNVQAYVLHGHADEFPSAECSTPRSQKSNGTSEIVYAEEVFLETINLDQIRNRPSAVTESVEIKANMLDVIELEQNNVELV